LEIVRIYSLLTAAELDGSDDNIDVVVCFGQIIRYSEQGTSSCIQRQIKLSTTFIYLYSNILNDEALISLSDLQFFGIYV